jgi:mRNA interferase MazF
MVKKYIPNRGDIVWLEFDPQMGHEQAGRRPALVLSPAIYNGAAGLALLCPITRQVKNYPFEVQLPNGLPIAGVILVDQLKSVDWRARKAAFIFHAPNEVIEQALQTIELLLRP